MYAQDTSIEQVMPWPGFGYNGTGAGGQPFHGFFNRSSNGPIPLSAAKTLLLQANLVTQSPNRVEVQGSSDDGFAVLAGLSTDNTKLQVLLNNYQLNYDIATEITAQIVSQFMLQRAGQLMTIGLIGCHCECNRCCVSPCPGKRT